MDPFALPPLAALLDAAYGALLGLSDLLEPLTGASSAAVAVVVITLLVRALLIPAGVSQARSEQARARLAPKLRQLQHRHRKNPERLQRETLRLYREENVSPFAGVLPVLLQAPVIGVLYTLFLRTEIAGHANELLAHDLFGAALGTGMLHMLTAGPFSPPTLLVTGALLAVMTVAAEISRRLLRPPASDATAPAWMPPMIGALHHLTAVFALFVPLAAALYLTVTAIWTLIQRRLLRRRFPLPV